MQYIIDVISYEVFPNPSFWSSTKVILAQGFLSRGICTERRMFVNVVRKKKKIFFFIKDKKKI